MSLRKIPQRSNIIGIKDEGWQLQCLIKFWIFFWFAKFQLWKWIFQSSFMKNRMDLLV